MKKFKKAFIALSATLLVGVTAAAIGSCKDKNAVKYVFETNGGEKVSSVELKPGKEYTLPVPEREGYEFEGWYTNAELTGDPVVSVVVGKGATYYAKWAKLCAIDLELNGGALANTTLYLKEGGNVYEFMQNYTPIKAGLTFGAWFNGDVELAQSTRMPSAGLTLSAKYKVAYKVEIWTQKLGSDEYEKTEELDGVAYENEQFASEQKRTGFKEVFVEGANGTVTEKTLSATASENVFRHYFNREQFTVTFTANYPDGTEGESQSFTVTYGEEVTMPNDYTYEGYCLIGWATSADGEVVYKSNFLYSALYNKEDVEEVPSESIKPERNTMLYAVWNRGYVDMFGSNDYIYLLDAESEVVYLSRGSVFFQGEYNAKNNEFLFIANGKALLNGKLFEDGTYTYQDEGRIGSSTLYEVGTGLVKTHKIYFDNTNGITYSVENEDGVTSQSVGTYKIDENGYYVATFTEGEGEFVGKTLTFVTGTVTVDDSKEPAFQVRNEEDVALGELLRFVVNEGSITYYPSAYQLSFTGFGTAVMNMGLSASSYFYTIEGDFITLKNSYGQEAGVLRMVEEMGKKGYAFYTKELDQSFTLENGGVLTMDGTYNVSYTLNGETVTGYYTTAASALGGTLVSFKGLDKDYKFLISSTTEERPIEGDEEGKTEQVTVYSAVEKSATYAEYYYQDGEGTYYAPMLVMDDTAKGEAIVYAYTKAKTFIEVSRGTYEYNETTKLYVYTAKKFTDEATLVDALVEPWDLSKVQSYVYAVDNSEATQYNIHYWYSVVTDEGEQSFGVQYTGANGETLTLVNGVGIYRAQGYVVTGLVSTSEGLTVIQSTVSTIYLELDDETMTLVALDGAPFVAAILAEDGTARRDAAMSFDGKGGATYTEYFKNAEGKDDQIDYVGTFVQTEETTAFGAYVFLFTSNDGTKTFKYLQLTASSQVYVAMYNETYNGEYESATGFLTLDGYGYMAKYVDSGNEYEGVYAIVSENVVQLSTSENGTFYFDLLEGRKFTARGQEYGTYLAINNQAMLDVVFELDGYGNLVVYTMEEDENGDNVRKDIDTDATYEIDGKVTTFRYQDADGKDVTIVGKLGIYQYSSSAFNVLYVSRKEVSQTFVNKNDWSVMILDDLGNATKYSADGKKVLGSYMTVTDELLYFVNSDGTEANIYRYDLEEDTVEVVKMESRGYYTKDLESLLFTEYGFAIFNGETRYYYNIVNNDVTIYRQDINNPAANKYGFVEEEFGEFAKDVVEYEGKTYYYNDGYALIFNRVEESKDKYPVLVTNNGTEDESDDVYATLEALSFAPTGEAEFSNVQGSVRINGNNYICYVTRLVNEAGDVEMYVQISGYRFDISVTYAGLDADGNSANTYEVTRMRYMQTYDSYMYMQMYYYYYMMYGATAANMVVTPDLFGTVSFNTEYDEMGNEIGEGPLFNGTFGGVSGMRDVKGDLITIKDAKYETLEKNLYKVEFVGEDSYTYRLYVGVQTHSVFQAKGYIIYALTRVQMLTTEDGYEVDVERVVTTEASGIYRGYPLYMKVKKDGVELPAGRMVIMDDHINYILRTYEELADGTQGKITSTEYYRIEFTEKTSGGVTEELMDIVAAYESVKITKEEVVTKYTADDSAYVDIVGEEVRLVFFNGMTYYTTETVVNEDGTYTAKTSYGVFFLVKVEKDGTVSIEEVELEETEESVA